LRLNPVCERLNVSHHRPNIDVGTAEVCQGVSAKKAAKWFPTLRLRAEVSPGTLELIHEGTAH